MECLYKQPFDIRSAISDELLTPAVLMELTTVTLQQKPLDEFTYSWGQACSRQKPFDWIKDHLHEKKLMGLKLYEKKLKFIL